MKIIFKLLIGATIAFSTTNSMAEDLPGNELPGHGGGGMFANPGVAASGHVVNEAGSAAGNAASHPAVAGAVGGAIAGSTGGIPGAAAGAVGGAVAGAMTTLGDDD